MASALAATLNVPGGYSTIQSAIDAAQLGDEVVVQPGTYFESIDFLGKNITVKSAKGPNNTIIDAGGVRSVARFHTGESNAAVLSGFTLQHGVATDYPSDGGGVQIYQASPTIQGNTIRDNSACSGNGIAAEFSAAIITGNHVLENKNVGCSGGTVGGGILVGGLGTVEVSDNLIENNSTDYVGGGIGLNAAGTPLIVRNTIRGNSAGTMGGGMGTLNASSPVFADNLVYENSAPQGGGVALAVQGGSPASFMSNNTVANNTGTQGSELYFWGSYSLIQLGNNIFSTSIGSISIYCFGDDSPTPPTFTFNDFYASNGAVAGGSCYNVLAGQGNIAVNPKFVGGRGANPYSLGARSPAVDAGLNSLTAGQTKDLAGHPRIVDGNGDGNAVVDLGAYEKASRR